MSSDAQPPSGRPAQFAEKLQSEPLGEPTGNHPASWFIGRIGLVIAGVAALYFGALFFAMSTCACTPPPSFPASPVEGVVVSVDSAGLGRVRSFVLRSAEGTTLFQVGTLENPTEFPPAHLAEHQASSSPVRVYFRVEAGGYSAVAYRLEDGAGPAATG